MSLYSIRIINHSVIGYPYVPICKFQISNEAKGRQMIEETIFINPPIYDSRIQKNDKAKVVQQNVDSTYLKQFPIDLENLTFRQNQLIHIKLIQLTKNGRQKLIGFTKITLNKDVINRTTKHRVIQFEGASPNLPEKTNKKQSDTKNQQVLSIIQVNLSGSTNKKKQVKQQLKKDDTIEQSHIQEQSQSKSSKSLNSYHSNYQKQDQADLQIDENDKFKFNQSREQDQNQSNVFEQKNQPLHIISKPRPKRNKIVIQSKSTSPQKTQSPFGKIIKQKGVTPQRQQTPNTNQNHKHKRRIKYILNGNQLNQRDNQKNSGRIIQNYRKQRIDTKQLIENLKNITQNIQVHEKNFHQSISSVPKKQQLRNKKDKHQKIEYFISKNETDRKGCNKISNLNLVYEKIYGQFSPRYLTFLTFQLYEKIVRVNYSQFESQSKNQTYQKQQKFVLEDQYGKFKGASVHHLLLNQQIFIPKYCLFLRVQLIMDDDAIYVGTLENKIGSRIKSILNFKKTVHSVQIPESRQTINMIFNVSEEKTVQAEQRKPFRKITDEKTMKKPRRAQHTENIQITLNPYSRQDTYNSIQQQDKLQNLQVAQNQVIQEQKYKRKQKKQMKSRNTQKKDVLNILSAISSYKNRLTQVSTQNVNKREDQERTLIKKLSQQHKSRSAQRQNTQPVQREEVSELIKNRMFKPKKRFNDQNSSQISQNQMSGSSKHSLRTLAKINSQNHQNTKSLSKDLPKIILHRANYKQRIEQKLEKLKEKFKQQNFIKNIKSQQAKFSKQKIRIEFFNKIMRNRHLQPHHNHMKNQSVHNIQRFKTSPDQRRDNRNAIKYNQNNQNKIKGKYRQLIDLPEADFHETKRAPKNMKNYSKTPTTNQSFSYQNKQSRIINHTRQLRCKRHERSLGNLHNIDEKSKQLKNINAARYKVTIKGIQFIKVSNLKSQRRNKNMKDGSQSQTQFEKYSQKKSLHQKQPKLQSENNIEIFLKLYNQRKKQKQFLTESKNLYKKQLSPQSKKRSVNTLVTSEYNQCHWQFDEDNEIIFKAAKSQDLIVVEAYGDLSQVDNHQFLGKCMFSLQQIIYLQKVHTITGYVVKKSKIHGHLAMDFQIQEY